VGVYTGGDESVGRCVIAVGVRDYGVLAPGSVMRCSWHQCVLGELVLSDKNK